jgi:hypothetical protein
MIRKSGNRFSEKIMLRKIFRGVVTIQFKAIALECCVLGNETVRRTGRATR